MNVVRRGGDANSLYRSVDYTPAMNAAGVVGYATAAGIIK